MAAVESIAPQVGTSDVVASVSEKKKQANKDLRKTKLCVYHLEGKCGLGSDCSFAHNVSEMKVGPDLTKTQLCVKFAEGNCTNKNCTYAHGEAELRDPPNFKKKICKWHLQGKCRNGTSCGFAHNGVELRGEAPPGFEGFLREAPPWRKAASGANKTKLYPPPPGLSLNVVADDVSTDAHSSQSVSESEHSMTSSPSTPDAQLFHMMAGRGSAAMQDQVATMGSAIGGLQAKLAALEDMMLQSQVAQMQQTIRQLTEQCGALEGALDGASKDAGTPIKSITRLSSKAIPFKPYTGPEDEHESITKVWDPSVFQ
jgi:hypothetical protein